MNTHLLSTTLFSPTLPAIAPWAGSGPATDGGPSGAAFTRALESARQGSIAASEPPRPPSPPPREAEGDSNRGEGSRRPEPARPAEHGDRATPADRAERGPRETTDERRARGAAASRPAETPRRTQAQAASRRDDGGNAADAPTIRGAHRGAEQVDDESALPGASGARGDDAPGADAMATLTNDVAAACRPMTPGEGGEVATTLSRGFAPRSVGAAEAALGGAGEPGTGALRAAGRTAGGALDAAPSETGPATAGRARGPGAAGHRPGDNALPGGVLDPAALGLRLMSAATAAAAGATALAAESGRAGEGLAGVQGGANATAPSPGALAAAWATPTAAADAAGAAGTVHEAGLKSPPGGEAFARELGAQVSVFVREGVQQARLHLNPQELGPVLVRIQLEGQAAQVHMAAELPQTRQALEQALPSLAGQLSEAGITLTGGGVFERPQQGFAEREARGNDTAGTSSFASRAVEGPAATMATTPEPGRWQRARGLVDLIA